jgi:hypothetical protein
MMLLDIKIYPTVELRPFFTSPGREQTLFPLLSLSYSVLKTSNSRHYIIQKINYFR